MTHLKWKLPAAALDCADWNNVVTVEEMLMLYPLSTNGYRFQMDFNVFQEGLTSFLLGLAGVDQDLDEFEQVSDTD